MPIVDYAASFELSGYDGIAHAGVAIVTCMDSRIDPLRMLGLQPGDAKIFRNPGGHVTQRRWRPWCCASICSASSGSSSFRTRGARWR